MVARYFLSVRPSCLREGDITLSLHHMMESILVGNLFIISQIQTNEVARTRNLRNTNAHRHPAFVDVLKLIERWVRSKNEQAELLENLFFQSKKRYNRHISTMSMWSLNVWSGLVTLLILFRRLPTRLQNHGRIFGVPLSGPENAIKRPGDVSAAKEEGRWNEKKDDGIGLMA